MLVGTKPVSVLLALLHPPKTNRTNIMYVELARGIESINRIGYLATFSGPPLGIKFGNLIRSGSHFGQSNSGVMA